MKFVLDVKRDNSVIGVSVRYSSAEWLIVQKALTMYLMSGDCPKNDNILIQKMQNEEPILKNAIETIPTYVPERFEHFFEGGTQHDD